MSKRLRKSLYWLFIVIAILSGCTQKEATIEALSPAPSSASSEVVITHATLETAATIPPIVESTSTVPIDPLSTDCNKIAFSEYDGLNYDIYTICPDGRQLTKITNDPADDVDPVWSPDGTRIAFTSTRSGHFQIYQMSADGTGAVQLTNDFENLKPVWLPDGRHIAFRTDDGKGLFWWRVLNLDNLELTTLTDASHDFFFQTPSWSPDGKRIAYMSLVEQQERNDGSSQIHVKNIDGTNDSALTHDTWANINPIWSPDGAKIAFLSERGGTINELSLYVMNSDGSDVQQISETGYPDDVVYSWSPDGKQIVIGNNFSFSGITIIDINSKTSRLLMTWPVPANVSSPSWQP